MVRHVNASTTNRIARELADLIRRGRARATLDDRTADEVLGYNEHGLPSRN